MFFDLYNGGMICCLILLQIASFLLYLSDVEEGGETMFPFEVRWENLSDFSYFSLFITSICVGHIE